jgi:hypothetical protein
MHKDNSSKISLLAHELVQSHMAESQISLKSRRGGHAHPTPITQSYMGSKMTMSNTSDDHASTSTIQHDFCPVSKYEAIELEALFYYVACQSGTTSQALKDFAAKALKIEMDAPLSKASYIRIRAFLWQCSLSSRS